MDRTERACKRADIDSSKAGVQLGKVNILVCAGVRGLKAAAIVLLKSFEPVGLHK